MLEKSHIKEAELTRSSYLSRLLYDRSVDVVLDVWTIDVGRLTLAYTVFGFWMLDQRQSCFHSVHQAVMLKLVALWRDEGWCLDATSKFRRRNYVPWKSSSWMNPVRECSGSGVVSEDAVFGEHDCAMRMDDGWDEDSRSVD
jgi:hypothetical protein